MKEAPAKKEKKEKKDKKEKSKKSKETTEAATPAKITEKDYERLAQAAGMSVSKFARRFERGQIKVKADGTLEVLSKKDFKEQGEEEAETPVKPKSSKRKHDEDEAEETPAAKEEKPKKKKKKSSKE